MLEKTAHLKIWQDDEVKRRVKGVVTWFELGENDGHQVLYSMRIRPPVWRAALRQNSRIFQNEDIKSILGTIGLVNLNLYPMRMHSDRILHLASDLIDIPGVYTVGGHGDRWGKTINNPDSPYRPYSVDDLAKIIKNDKNYKLGMPVKLFSCELAYGRNGSFASQLAKKLHAKVIAADTNWDV